MQAELSNISIYKFNAEQYNQLGISGHLTAETIQQHWHLHCTGIGMVTGHNNNTMGIAGLNYLHEVQLYEVYIELLPEYRNTPNTSAILSMVVNNAFENLGIDKVCTRAIAGSVNDIAFKKYGFSYCDERSWADDNYVNTWNYYELENNSAFISVEDHAVAADNDWEGIF
jgi:hypothetical protein